MPFSRSRSPESMARSSTCWCSPKAPPCHSIASTSVVLPWSTCATIATLRRSERLLRVVFSDMRLRTLLSVGAPAGTTSAGKTLQSTGGSGASRIVAVVLSGGMDYVKLGRTGLDVSRICLGCMTFGAPDRGNHDWTLTEDDSRPLIRQAL